MKQMLKRRIVMLAVVAAAAVAVMGNAFPQSYPITNPTYLPNSVKPSATMSAPGTYVFNNNGTGVVALEVEGTCTSLAAVVQGTVDGTHWTTMNVWPVTTGTITAASAVAATGVWRTASAAMKQIRVNVTALTASCTFTMIGAPVNFTSTY